MRNQITLALLILTSAASQAAQICNDRIVPTAPSSRFTDNRDGTVTDLRTGLTWQRCMMGYVFADNGTPFVMSDDTCTASVPVTFTWQLALQGAASRNGQGGYAGFTDWRVPNIKELISIVEMQCASPAINLLVFPGTPERGEFFSATPFNVGTGTTSISLMDFQYGLDTYAVVDPAFAPAYFVRLVR